MKRFASIAVLALVALSLAAYAADGSSLKPPAGAKVAVVMFEDMECPDCANAYPVVWEAAKAHHIPVVLHDFPLPKHAWSLEAAVYARFFDTKSEQIGDDFRGYIFHNQPQITAGNLRQYVQKFADDNKIPVPFVVDPEGKLKAKVMADHQLGQQAGLEHTPTIFVVGSGGASPSFVEVQDRKDLSQIIEDMIKKSGPSTPAKRPAGSVKRPASKGKKKAT